MYAANGCCAQGEHGAGLSLLFENGYCGLALWQGLEVARWKGACVAWVWALGVGMEEGQEKWVAGGQR